MKRLRTTCLLNRPLPLPLVVMVFLMVPVRGLAQSPLDLLKGKVPDPDRRVHYGTNELQFGELRLPKGAGPHPVVVLLDGGCWKARPGGLDPRATSLDLLRPIAASLTEAGIATWNLEYRRVGNEGGGSLGTFQDVAEATDF